ncbi:MAG: ABC transporter permease [Thermoguttaceae bacterium]
MITWRLIARDLRRHIGRSALTLLSIAIGIASVIAASLATATTRQAYRRMYEEIAGRAALQITAPANESYPEEITEKIAQIPGVQAAVPSYQRATRIVFEHKWLVLIEMGIDPLHDSDAREYELREGRFLTSSDSDSGLLEIGFATGAGIHVGDQVKFLSAKVRKPGHLGTVTIVGLLAPRGPAAFNKGGAMFVPLHFAQRYLGDMGKINDIDIVLADSADESAVAQRIREILPPGLDVHPPASASQLAKGTTTEVEWGLSFASMFAVVLAFIIIANTFLMKISERRPQIAILRAVGATRRQIVGMMLREALILGIAGTLLGCVMGLVGGYLLMVAITRLYVDAPPPVIFSPLPFVLALAFGPALSLAAAAVPTWATTRVTPLEAMRPVVTREGSGVPRWMPISGIALLIVVAGLLVASVHGWLPSWLSIELGALAVALVVLVIPVLVRPLVAFTGWLLRPLGLREICLAQRQVIRHPVRSALTIGVVYVATAIGIGLGTIIATTVGDVHSWYRQTLQGDFFLRTAFPNTTTDESALVPDTVEEEVRRIPGVTSVDTMRFFHAHVGGHTVIVVSREFPDAEPPIALYRADPHEVRRRLYQGEVVIGTKLGQELNAKPGDEIEVDTTRRGSQKLRVAALAIDYMVGGEIMYLHRAKAEKLFDVQGVNTVLATVRPDSLSAVHDALAQIARRDQLMLHSFADLSRMLDRMMGGVVGGLWAILALGLVVAAFGIANTLTMNVLEQTRELALLRVVAMTRRQIRRLMLAQAGIIGLIGLGLGFVDGISTAYATGRSMMPLLGYPVDFLLHPWLLAGCLGFGLALVLIAALAPAERAARLDLLIALQYE